MQQFVVPQFIDVEGKIIGPITTRQFVLMLGGGLLIFLTYKVAAFTVFLFTTFFIVFLVIIFGFIKVNSRPIHIFLYNVLKTVFGRPLLRAWKREIKMGAKNVIMDIGISDTSNKEVQDNIVRKSAVRSRLSELSLVVDTGGVYNDTEL